LKTYEPSNLRNIALLSHQAAGKTTLAEAILYKTRAIGRMGSVDEGTSNLDYHPNEIERKTSIYLALGCCEYEGTKFNILDTPGFEDFRGDVMAALSVVESAVVLVRADGGVEVGTESLWETVQELQLPTMLVVSRMDKEHANFQAALDQIHAQLSPKAIPIQLPIGEGEAFKGVIDVAKGEAYLYDNDGEATAAEIPPDMKDRYEATREELLNAAAEHDDELVEKFLEEGTLSYEEIVKGIRIGVRDRTFIPVCAVSAQSLRGMKAMLHAVKEYLPAAEAFQEVAGLNPEGGEAAIPVGPEAPVAARVFKISLEKEAGEFALMRVYGGSIAAGDELFNKSRGQAERLTQLFQLEGKNREKIETIGCGDFGAAVKLKDTHAGDTLGDKKSAAQFKPIAYPPTNTRMAISPLSAGDDEKMVNGLNKIREEDPTFSIEMDPQTHEMVMQGQGELHFDIILQNLKEGTGVEVQRREPRIPYLETIKGKTEIQARHKKQTGGRGQFADVSIRFEALPRGSGFEFVDSIVGGAIPGKFIPAVEKGLKESMQKGPLAACQVVDLRATLYDGGFHAVDSSEAAFKTAASSALRECFAKTQAVLLEPIYEIEVKCPEEVMGDVMGDLSSRRGRIMGSENRGHFAVVSAHVPLAELYRYSTALRSMTQGRGTHSRKFHGYEEVPADLMSKIIATAKKVREGD
jgi:elongation factor G